MPCIGAEVLAEPGVQGVWLKTHIVRRGTYLVATTYIVSDGNLEVLKIQLDVKPIMRRLVRLHQQMHAADAVSGHDVVGFGFKSMGGLAKKAWGAGKSKLAKKVYSTSKGIIRSKVTAGVVAATAVAFPPVGAPAAAALATANVALNYVEQGQKVAREAQAIAERLKQGDGLKKTLTHYGQKYGRQALSSYVQGNPQLKANLSMAMQFKAKVSAALTPPRKAELASTMAKYRKGKAFLQAVSRQARYGKGQRQVEARKMATIVRIAADNRARIRAVATGMQGGLPGILIDRRGRIITGRFMARPTTTGIPDIFITADGMKPGRYRKVRPSRRKRRRLRAYALRRRARRRARARRRRALRAVPIHRGRGGATWTQPGRVVAA